MEVRVFVPVAVVHVEVLAWTRVRFVLGRVGTPLAHLLVVKLGDFVG